jgi:hypothetical protein
MKRTDDVFFFTLIDFLIQVFFFGLLLYVVTQAREAGTKSTVDQANKQAMAVAKWTGFSSLTELTDLLTNLAPPVDFRGWADFMSKSAAKPAEAKTAIDVARRAGGVDALVNKVKKYEETFGLPPCHSIEKEGKRVERSIALLRLEDQHIEVLRDTPEFAGVVSSIGVDVSQKRFTLQDFRQRFSVLRRPGANCVNYVDLEVRTERLPSMDALQSGFRYLSRK